MKPLVFSMGFNGYQWIYRDLIASHRAYCDRHEYDYVMVERPRYTPLMKECAWLKLPLIADALRAGRPWVLFLDADVQITEISPGIDTVLREGKFFYLAKGRSGRINSGVILTVNDRRSISLLDKMVSSALDPIPSEDNVGWGENGHVVNFLKNSDLLQELEIRWNNTTDDKLIDYFRHFTGPLKKSFKPDLIGKLSKRSANYYLHAMKILGVKEDDALFHFRLQNLRKSVAKYYNEFKGT